MTAKDFMIYYHNQQCANIISGFRGRYVFIPFHIQLRTSIRGCVFDEKNV